MEDCCADLGNRLPPERVAEDLTVERCGECGRRHFELTADAGELGLVGSGL